MARSPSTTTVGFLPQEPDADPGETLRAYLARRTGVAAASQALDAAMHALGDDGPSIEAYSEALEHFLAIGGDDLDARTGAVLAEVGPAGRPARRRGRPPVRRAAARAALAAILLSRQDVLLLDEPTNDLDFAGLDQLERFVASTPAAVVVVSHDRTFLDRTVDRIVELRLPDHDAVEHAGGWSDFVDVARAGPPTAAGGLRQVRAPSATGCSSGSRRSASGPSSGVKNAKKKKTDNDKFIPHLKSQTLREDGRQGQGHREGHRAAGRRRQAVGAVAAPARAEGGHPSGRRRRPPRSGGGRARARSASARSTSRWRGRTGSPSSGPNGSGKTTLLRAILGEVELASGTRWLGPGVTVGLLDQRRLRYGSDEPLLPSFMATTGLDRSEARSLLAKFGLGADHIDRAGADLSPGERTRALLAELMAQGVNCLVLDEPTNHLDLEAIEQLESALDAFDGTLLLVTHDRAFLDAVHVTTTIDLGAGTPSPPR